MPVIAEWTNELATFLHFQAWLDELSAEEGVTFLSNKCESEKKAKLAPVHRGP